MDNYIGQKGYSIYKNNLSVQQQEKIRNELNVTPSVKNMGYGKLPSFYVYRESPKKFYVPRFYGMEVYGEPDDMILEDGKSINLKFKGELRPKQKPVVEKYMKHIKNKYSGLTYQLLLFALLENAFILLY